MNPVGNDCCITTAAEKFLSIYQAYTALRNFFMPCMQPKSPLRKVPLSSRRSTWKKHAVITQEG